MSNKLTPVDDLKQSIERMKPQFKTALPTHINVDKFSRVLMTAISTNPSIAEVNRTTVFASCMKLAQMGLMPDNREAAIVTFNSKNGPTAQAMPMIAGILKMARNSGEILSIGSHIVYEKDEFSYWIDEDGEHIKHVPKLTGDRGSISHVYCLAKTKDGGIYLEVMSKPEIDAIRDVSRAKNGGPWTDWYGEMAKKSVLRRLAKRLPSSTDLDLAVSADDELYDLRNTAQVSAPQAEAKEVLEPEKKRTTPKKLAAIIEAESQPVQETPEQELPI